MMNQLSTDKYQSQIREAVRHFWATRGAQKNAKQKKSDQGNRGAVTGGKQLHGFIELFRIVSEDFGVPNSCIHVKGNELPGYFRPTKDWDLLIISPNHELIAAVEFKSQVGSFGNN
ncbi:MAG: PaeR7I family type II restriction endonuclease, partial [Bacteroidota bacterium]